MIDIECSIKINYSNIRTTLTSRRHDWYEAKYSGIIWKIKLGSQRDDQSFLILPRYCFIRWQILLWPWILIC